MTDIKELAPRIAEEINRNYADLNGDDLPRFCPYCGGKIAAGEVKP